MREEDYRNHAVAQAMDEARHHLAYCRFLEKMGDEVEDIDLGTEMMFDALLEFDDPMQLIATEQGKSADSVSAHQGLPPADARRQAP